MSDYVVSVLISSRDRAPHLRHSLPTVLTSARGSSRPCEVVVIDNGSSDATPSVLSELAVEYPELRVISDPRPPKTAALNRALRQLRGTVVVFTDDDVHVPPTWVDDMVTPILGGRADASAGRVRLAAHLDRPWLTPLMRQALAEFEPAGPDSMMSGMVGANMAATIAAARMVGFDEELGPGARGFADDVLFNLRLKAGGMRVVGVRSAPAEHFLDPARLTREAMLDLARRNGDSHAYLWHHWYQSSLGYLSLRLWRDSQLLRLHSHLRGGSVTDIDEREYTLNFQVSFFAALRKERRVPPRYSAIDRGGTVGRAALVDTRRGDSASG